MGTSAHLKGVGAYCEEAGVKSAMMESAGHKAVSRVIGASVTPWLEVSCVEDLWSTNAAHCTDWTVALEDAELETLLADRDDHFSADVCRLAS